MPTQNYKHVRMIMTSQSGYNETNFCTVAAIATAFNWAIINYKELKSKSFTIFVNSLWILFLIISETLR